MSVLIDQKKLTLRLVGDEYCICGMYFRVAVYEKKSGDRRDRVILSKHSTFVIRSFFFCLKTKSTSVLNRKA